MKYRKFLTFVALAVAASAFTFGPGLKLTPATISNGAVAKWVKFGSDSNHALYLSKNVATSEFEAAAADIGRVSGRSVGDLTMLGWTLLDGTREGGSPRWNIYLDHNGNGSYDFEDVVVFLDHNTAGGEDDSFDMGELQAQIVAQGGSLEDSILYLQIIVDVQHTVVLDDIKVGFDGIDTTFSGPGKSE